MSSNAIPGLPSTDPAPLMRLRDSIYAADLFVAAVAHLDLFSVLQSPKTFSELCSQLQLKARPADVMITLMKSLGLIEESSLQLQLTAAAQEHLLSSSPWFLGPYVASQKLRPICLELLNVLRTDRPIPWAAANAEVEWPTAMMRPDFSESFTRAMDSRGAYLAPALAARLSLPDGSRILDIGGASGIYAAALLATNPSLTGSVLERRPVDEVARHSIQKRGFEGRLCVVAGDMFQQDYPAGHDVHLYSNVLHDWDEASVDYLIRKSYSALPKDGMIVIHDAHVNPDKSGPLAIAEYSVLLMCLTQGKCYSVSEVERSLTRAGFANMRVVETVASRSVITATK